METENNQSIFGKIGGIAGLIAVLGLIVAILQLAQSLNSDREDRMLVSTQQAQHQANNALQATRDEAQFAALEKIVFLQAQLVEGQPAATATAIAQQIQILESTITIPALNKGGIHYQ